MKLQCELRPYQREGIAWLAFLRRTGLHGCLADDMGLGKTLQATAIIAGLTFTRSISQQLMCLLCMHHQTRVYMETSV